MTRWEIEGQGTHGGVGLCRRTASYRLLSSDAR